MLVSFAIQKVREDLNDFTQSVWKDEHIIDFINEAIIDIKNTVPEYYTDLDEIETQQDTINIPNAYKFLITLFASARCFEQDEQHYRASQRMNEYEIKKSRMEVQILDNLEYADDDEVVRDVYHYKPHGDLE